MANSRLLEENKNNQPPRWEFEFLSALTGEPADQFYYIQPENSNATCEICKEMGNKVFLIREAVKGKNFPPLHPNCRCLAVDKDGNPVVLWIDRYLGTMAQSYGFTEEESQLILQAYQLLANAAKRQGLPRQQQIHYIFSNLAALCDAYSGANLLWKLAASHPATEVAKSNLIELGMSEDDVEALYAAIMQQYESEDRETDFAHEMAVLSIAAEDSWLNTAADMFVADLTAVGSYKGDVFSASMPLDDMNADVDGINVYNRMLTSNKGFLDVLIEYNEEVRNGTINRVDEFLRFYGDGDAQKGLQYIKDDLLNVDMASHYLSTRDIDIADFIGETIQDMFLRGATALQGVEVYNKILKSTNANKVFEESEIYKESYDGKKHNAKSIADEMEAFIKYLEEGMSK